MESSVPDTVSSSAQTKQKDTFSFGAVFLTGLSLLGAASCTSGPASAHDTAEVSDANLSATDTQVCLSDQLPKARVIVLDDFWQAETRTTHGESVESELIRLHETQGDDANLTVERKHIGLYTGDHGLKDGEPGALTSYLKDHFAGRMNRNSTALREVVDQGGPRAVLHQSQGASQSRVVDALFYRAGRDANFRGQLQQQLGLEQTASYSKNAKTELLGHLVSQADAIYREDSQVKDARLELRSLQNQLHEQGYIHVISAGNNGYLARDMVELGVTTPDGFFSNDLASEHSIVVGASDDGSKTTNASGVHQVAKLASPDAGAHIGADGVNRPLQVDGKDGHHSGSSYAAPQVSSAILTQIRRQPEIGRDQVLQKLQSQANPVPGAESYLGAGTLDAHRLLVCFD